MHTYTTHTDDIDEFFSDEAGFHSDYIQLSPGALQFHSRVLELPDITLHWNHFGKRMRIREAYLEDMLILGYVFDSPGRFLLKGRELLDNQVVILQPGKELEYVTPPGLRSLYMKVSARCVEGLGWHLSDATVMQVPRPQLMALVEVCRHATRAADRPDSSLQAGINWRNRILACLGVVLQPWFIPARDKGMSVLSSSKQYLLARRAEHIVAASDPGDLPSLATLADTLGISERTLFYAFNKWLGVSPRAYFHLLRLHTLRDRLLAGKSSAVTVTHTATELGFGHLGRLSGEYHRFFGEYPSDTLNHATAGQPGQ